MVFCYLKIVLSGEMERRVKTKEEKRLKKEKRKNKKRNARSTGKSGIPHFGLRDLFWIAVLLKFSFDFIKSIMELICFF